MWRSVPLRLSRYGVELTALCWACGHVCVAVQAVVVALRQQSAASAARASVAEAAAAAAPTTLAITDEAAAGTSTALDVAQAVAQSHQVEVAARGQLEESLRLALQAVQSRLDSMETSASQQSTGHMAEIRQQLTSAHRVIESLRGDLSATRTALESRLQEQQQQLGMHREAIDAAIALAAGDSDLAPSPEPLAASPAPSASLADAVDPHSPRQRVTPSMSPTFARGKEESPPHTVGPAFPSHTLPSMSRRSSGGGGSAGGATADNGSGGGRGSGGSSSDSDHSSDVAMPLPADVDSALSLSWPTKAAGGGGGGGGGSIGGRRRKWSVVVEDAVFQSPASTPTNTPRRRRSSTGTGSEGSASPNPAHRTKGWPAVRRHWWTPQRGWLKVQLRPPVKTPGPFDSLVMGLGGRRNPQPAVSGLFHCAINATPTALEEALLDVFHDVTDERGVAIG